jgi:hypothetical protein
VINGKRMVRMIGPRSPAAGRADASIGTRFSVEERTPSRPRRLVRLGRTLLERARVALQVGRCVGLAVGFGGSRTLPINAPAAFRMQKLRRSFTFLRARRLKQPCRSGCLGLGYFYILTRLRKIRQPSATSSVLASWCLRLVGWRTACMRQ